MNGGVLPAVHRTKPACYDLLIALTVLYNPFREVTPREPTDGERRNYCRG